MIVAYDGAARLMTIIKMMIIKTIMMITACFRIDIIPPLRKSLPTIQPAP